MLIERMNWMQIEDYLKKDDRVVVVMGSTEEHGYLTVGTDTQVTWEIAKEAADKAGVLVAPAINYGPAGWVTLFPGTISIKPTTTLALISDILESLTNQGFKRILILAGHNQNQLAKWVIEEMATKHQDIFIKFREWYLLPKTYATIESYENSHFDHASWLENFPWINNCCEVPDMTREPATQEDFITYGPKRTRELMPEGVAGGAFKQDEQVMRRYFNAAVNEVVEILEDGWEKHKM